MRKFLSSTVGRLLLFAAIAAVAIIVMLRSFAPAGPSGATAAGTAAIEPSGSAAPGPLCERDDPAALSRAAAACSDDLEACRLRVDARLRQLPQKTQLDSNVILRVRPDATAAWTLVVEDRNKISTIWSFQPCQETLVRGTSY